MRRGLWIALGALGFVTSPGLAAPARHRQGARSGPRAPAGAVQKAPDRHVRVADLAPEPPPDDRDRDRILRMQAA
jgi:hypothetical protein